MPENIPTIPDPGKTVERDITKRILKGFG